jgi:ABC-2 type transport system ATP-binding protein
MPFSDAVNSAMVDVRGLTKRYGAFTAVADLDLDIRRGELFALLGPNGAGKTTTMRLLMGILRPDAGTAHIDGLDCFEDRVALKHRVGFLPDEPVFYDYLRGRELIEFVTDLHGLSAEEGRRRSMPLIERLGLADDLEEYAVNYSRGMKKKLALICAVLHDPDLLILDEPTSGLDPIATRNLNVLLAEWTTAGKTILLSSHLLDHVQRNCERMAIMTGGRVAAVGTLSELRGRASAGSTLEEVFFAVTEGTNSAAPT